MKDRALILALIGFATSVLGFYFSSFVADIRANGSLVYALDVEEDDRVVLKINNVSAIKTIPFGSYAIICRSKDNAVPDACLSDETLVFKPPVWLVEPTEKKVLTGVATTVIVNIDLPPGGAFEVSAKVAAPAQKELFFLFSQPGSDASTPPVTLIQGRFGTTFVLTRYHYAMALAFLASVLVTGLLMLGLAWTSFRPDDRKKDAKMSPPYSGRDLDLVIRQSRER